MQVAKRVVKIVSVSALLVLGTGVAVFLPFPRSAAVTAVLSPGVPVAGFIGRFIPSSLLYAVVPEGGAPAFLLLVAIFAFCFWTAVASVVYFVWARYTRSRAV
jgi:hypothetical protein